jgi:hypothetical protein
MRAGPAASGKFRPVAGIRERLLREGLITRVRAHCAYQEPKSRSTMLPAQLDARC